MRNYIKYQTLSFNVVSELENLKVNKYKYVFCGASSLFSFLYSKNEHGKKNDDFLA